MAAAAQAAARAAAALAHRQFLDRWGGLLYGGTKIEIIHFLQAKALIPPNKICNVCGGQMQLTADAVHDGYRW